MMVKESFTWFLMVQLDNTRSAGQRIIQCNHFNYYRLATSGKNPNLSPLTNFVWSMQCNAMLCQAFMTIYTGRGMMSLFHAVLRLGRTTA